MTIVDSLKKLLTRFGGDASALKENATSSDVIDAISEAYIDKEGTYTEVTPIVTEGTKIATITTNNTPHDIYAPNPPTELPAVTSADEGDVLGVNSNGEWVKTTPSGGGAEPFVFTLSYDNSTSSYETNKTYEEIVSAYKAGKSLYVLLDSTVTAHHQYASHFEDRAIALTYGSDPSDSSATTPWMYFEATYLDEEHAYSVHITTEYDGAYMRSAYWDITSTSY